MAKKAKAAKAAKVSKSDALRATREAAAGGKKKGDGIPTDAPAAAHRPVKKKNLELPGLERPVDAELDGLAGAFIEQSDTWSAAQKEANELKLKIAEMMGAKGIAKYRYHDGEETRDFTFAAAKLRVVKVKAKQTEVAE